MTNILLVRHGRTDAMQHVLCGRAANVHLSQAGLKEARGVGRRLRRICDLEAVYASPLERATETAREIALRQGLPVQVDPRWNELDFGEWQGRTFAELDPQENWRRFNSYRSLHCPPGGECMVAVQTRTAAALTSILDRHAGGNVAVVSHCDVIRSLLLLLLGMPIDHVFRLEIAPASVTLISAGEGRAPVIHYLNATAPAIPMHLASS